MSANASGRFQLVEEKGWMRGLGNLFAGRVLGMVQILQVVETPYHVVFDH